jgi:hypothetical protein
MSFGISAKLSIAAKKIFSGHLRILFLTFSFLAIFYVGFGVYIAHPYLHSHVRNPDFPALSSAMDIDAGVYSSYAAADVSDKCTICSFLASLQLQFSGLSILRIFILLNSLIVLTSVCSLTAKSLPCFRIRGPPQPLLF